MSSSDSDEFFDAEDITPCKLLTKCGPKVNKQMNNESTRLIRSDSEPCIKQNSFDEISTQRLIETFDINKHQKKSPPCSLKIQQNRKKLSELRKHLEHEDEDFERGNMSGEESQTSSLNEAICGGAASTSSGCGLSHPFRIVEHDTVSLQSMNSLGKVGRILSGAPGGLNMKAKKTSSMSTISQSSKDSTSESWKDDYRKNIKSIPPPQKDRASSPQPICLQEPDVIASTKNGKTYMMTTTQSTNAPVAPPRRKKKGQQHNNLYSVNENKKMSIESTNSYDQRDNIAVDDDPLLDDLNLQFRINKRISEIDDTVSLDQHQQLMHKKYKVTTPTSRTTNSQLKHSDVVSDSSRSSTIKSMKDYSSDSTKSNTIKDNSESTKSKTSRDGLINNNSIIDITRSTKSLKDNFIINDRSLLMDCTRSKSFKETKSSETKSAVCELAIAAQPKPIRGGDFGVVAKDDGLFDVKSIKNLDNLNLISAIKGIYVVKPQDDVKSKSGSKDPNSQCLEYNQTTRGDVYAGGHSSLGSHRLNKNKSSGSTQRRRSAGDEELIRQMNMFVRVRTDSGKQLTDKEILEQVTVLNLDTGERVPLSVAENKLPQCINPLSLHIMRLTSEYVSTTSIDKDDKESDDDETNKIQSTIVQEEDGLESNLVRKRTAKIKRFLGSTVKKTMNKAKSIAQEVSHARHKEDVMDLVDEVNPTEPNVKLKASNSHKGGPYEFENTTYVQELKCAISEDDTTIEGGHFGPIWCMKFSRCGRLLATAGQDRILRVWVVKEAYPYFQAMRNKYNTQKISPTPSQESLNSTQHHPFGIPSTTKGDVDDVETSLNTETTVNKHIFMTKPFCLYTGHTSDLLDVSWSKNYFLLSSSMDKTVRLWHITRNECLCCFQHIDFVTAIVFHPKDDRYFLSGSLDGKLRLWNIPDKKVAVWNEVSDGQSKLITAVNFCQNGKFAVVGTYDGRCIFYSTYELKYHTQIEVKSTSSSSSTRRTAARRNARGRKISGIEPLPGEDKILVTSNDSRIRLYDLSELNVSCKYKGYVNLSSHIKASFSHDGKYIVCGSENRDIYIWKTHHDYSKFSSARRDKNDYWEAIKTHNCMVTCAVFAPDPNLLIKMVEDRYKRAEALRNGGGLLVDEEEIQDPVIEQHKKGCGGYVLVSADFNGCIKVFINKQKPKHSSLPASAMA